MKVKDGSMQEFKHVHAICSGTEINIVEGYESPHYVEFDKGNDWSGVFLQVGVRWLEQHFPTSFAEAMKSRLLQK